jgi:hypothetical protein
MDFLPKCGIIYLTISLKGAEENAILFGPAYGTGGFL